MGQVNDIHSLVRGLANGTIEGDDPQITSRLDEAAAASARSAAAAAAEESESLEAREVRERKEAEEAAKHAKRLAEAKRRAAEIQASLERKGRARERHAAHLAATRGGDPGAPTPARGTDYLAWDLWTPSDEEDEMVAKLPPRGLEAMEADLDARSKRVAAARAVAEARRREGNAALAEGRTDEAYRLYLEGIQSRRDSAALHSNAALCCLRTGRPAAALDHCDKALSIQEFLVEDLKSPLTLRAFHRRARARLELGHPREAVADLERASRLATEGGRGEHEGAEIDALLATARNELAEERRRNALRAAEASIAAAPEPAAAPEAVASMGPASAHLAQRQRAGGVDLALAGRLAAVDAATLALVTLQSMAAARPSLPLRQGQGTLTPSALQRALRAAVPALSVCPLTRARARTAGLDADDTPAPLLRSLGAVLSGGFLSGCPADAIDALACVAAALGSGGGSSDDIDDDGGAVTAAERAEAWGVLNAVVQTAGAGGGTGVVAAASTALSAAAASGPAGRAAAAQALAASALSVAAVGSAALPTVEATIAVRAEALGLLVTLSTERPVVEALWAWAGPKLPARVLGWRVSGAGAGPAEVASRLDLFGRLWLTGTGTGAGAPPPPPTDASLWAGIAQAASGKGAGWPAAARPASVRRAALGAAANVLSPSAATPAETSASAVAAAGAGLALAAQEALASAVGPAGWADPPLAARASAALARLVRGPAAVSASLTAAPGLAKSMVEGLVASVASVGAPSGEAGEAARAVEALTRGLACVADATGEGSLGAASGDEPHLLRLTSALVDAVAAKGSLDGAVANAALLLGRLLGPRGERAVGWGGDDGAWRPLRERALDALADITLDRRGRGEPARKGAATAAARLAGTCDELRVRLRTGGRLEALHCVLAGTK